MNTTRLLPVVGLLLSACATPWTLADLRTDLVKTRATDPALAERGRALLAEVARVHGEDALQRHRTLSVLATDDWDAHPLGAVFGWWKTPVQRLRHTTLLGTFTSQMALLDGPEAGTTLGIQGWRPYRLLDGVARPTPDDERTSFYLPTLQYFSELPFRLRDADVVVYAGEATFAGRRYERVFVSWSSATPHREHDQFDLWIDAETRRLTSCRYTVRDAFAGATGTIFFEDFREVDGVLLAFRHTVMLEGHADLDEVPTAGWFHRLQLLEADFDHASPDALLVLDGVAPGSGKPDKAPTP